MVIMFLLGNVETLVKEFINNMYIYILILIFKDNIFSKFCKMIFNEGYSTDMFREKAVPQI